MAEKDLAELISILLQVPEQKAKAFMVGVNAQFRKATQPQSAR